MAIAYMLITTEPAKEHIAYNALCKLAVVDEIFPLFGEYDLIIKVSAIDKDGLKKKIINKIRPVEGILTIKTLFGY
ncbi:unnamed protein product [marine sediment metagenome]|uniref:Transcription regulator AsnC/Lrp ligand binding domain-containing protein n=1 Tax=marine sediment metagenome TaxID=412755 RepID=X1KCZ2_9ZZZZ